MGNGFNNSYQSDNITLSPVNVLKMRILARRDAVINLQEEYFLKESRGIDSQFIKSQLRASIKALYNEVKQAYLRDVEKAKDSKDKKIIDIDNLIRSKDINELFEAFEYIEYWIYNIKKLTMFDTNRSYDVTNPLEEDEVNNL